MLVSGISRGGAGAHPLFLNQAEAKAPKNFFSETGHSHYLRVWMTGPPPYLNVRICRLVGHYWDLRRVKKGILQYQESGICTKPKNENARGELGLLFSVTIACKQAPKRC